MALVTVPVAAPGLPAALSNPPSAGVPPSPTSMGLIASTTGAPERCRLTPDTLTAAAAAAAEADVELAAAAAAAARPRRLTGSIGNGGGGGDSGGNGDGGNAGSSGGGGGRAGGGGGSFAAAAAAAAAAGGASAAHRRSSPNAAAALAAHTAVGGDDDAGNDMAEGCTLRSCTPAAVTTTPLVAPLNAMGVGNGTHTKCKHPQTRAPR